MQVINNYNSASSVYGIEVGDSLSFSQNTKKSWVGFKSGIIFYINDVYINRETGNPIEQINFKK